MEMIKTRSRMGGIFINFDVTPDIISPFFSPPSLNLQQTLWDQHMAAQPAFFIDTMIPTEQ